MDAKALTDLARSPQDLRDRTLLGGFDVQSVARVEIKRKDTTLVLERKGEDDWQLVAPRQGKARGARVSDFLWTLRGLRWRDLVAEQGWDAAKYGLDAPATTITLTGKDRKPLASLAIGNRDKGDAYVRVPDQPALYAVETRGLGEIPATPEDLLL